MKESVLWALGGTADSLAGMLADFIFETACIVSVDVVDVFGHFMAYGIDVAWAVAIDRSL